MVLPALVRSAKTPGSNTTVKPNSSTDVSANAPRYADWPLPWAFAKIASAIVVSVPSRVA
jgi:hypothetical protein